MSIQCVYLNFSTLGRTVIMEPSKPTEKICFLGWRRDLRDVIYLLDSQVKYDTEVHVLCEIPLAERSALLEMDGFDLGTLS